MIESTKDLEKRLAQLKREVPTRGFERHPSFINSLVQLPPELQTPAVGLADGHFQTMIVFPPQIQRGRHYVPRQALLFTPTEVTHLLASVWPDEPPQVTRIDAHDLLYMKVSLLLLYGFLEIVGRGHGFPYPSVDGIQHGRLGQVGRPCSPFAAGKPATAHFSTGRIRLFPRGPIRRPEAAPEIFERH